MHEMGDRVFKVCRTEPFKDGAKQRCGHLVGDGDSRDCHKGHDGHCLPSKCPEDSIHQYGIHDGPGQLAADYFHNYIPEQGMEGVYPKEYLRVEVDYKFIHLFERSS